MTAGFFGLVVYMIEHNRNKGICMSAPHIDASQDGSGAPDARPFDEIKNALEQRLLELLPAHANPDDLLTAAMHYGVLGAGRRECSLMFLSIVRDLGRDTSELLDLAGAIEIVHAAFMILNDLPYMGDRKLRCGRAAAHVKFGEDVAMLAAVALLSHAFDIVSCVDGVSPDTRMRLTRLLAQAVAVHGSARSQYLRGTQDKPLIAIATTDALSTDNMFGVVMEMAAIVTQTSVETT